MTLRQPAHAEHGIPSPRDLRVLQRMEYFPKLGEFTKPEEQSNTHRPGPPTLVLPAKLSHPHYVRIRFPDLPGREPSSKQTTLTIKPIAEKQSHHLLQTAHALSALYWAFMSTKGDTESQPQWQDLPIPPRTGISNPKKGQRTERDQVILNSYGFSQQDRATISDAMQYVIIPTLTGRSKGSRKQADPDRMEAYANRIKTQIDEFLKHAGQELRPTFHMATSGSTVQACRFDLIPAANDPAPPEYAACPSIEDLLRRLSPDIARRAADHLERTPFARVYDEAAIWLIKPPQERYWTQATALNDADIIFSDHMQAAQPAHNEPPA